MAQLIEIVQVKKKEKQKGAVVRTLKFAWFPWVCLRLVDETLHQLKFGVLENASVRTTSTFPFKCHSVVHAQPSNGLCYWFTLRGFASAP